MRRFITSLPGKIISHVVAVSLLMPAFTLAVFTSRAEAQIAVLDQIAINQFDNTAPAGGGDLGKMMAEAMGNELSKANAYDVKPLGSKEATQGTQGTQRNSSSSHLGARHC